MVTCYHNNVNDLDCHDCVNYLKCGGWRGCRTLSCGFHCHPNQTHSSVQNFVL